LVKANVGRVFEESEGAIIFDGEKFGLHKRVFLTAAGTPTYEGKEMALAYRQFEDFSFDKNIHVVANEQVGYFQVVIKAIEMLDPKFVGREQHLSMGMIQLVGKKISSRTGVVLTVDGLLDEVKESVRPLIKSEGMNEREREEVAEKVTMAAVKYSVLKTDPTMNSQFDIKQSVSLEGNSGPYLLYTYARTRAVVRKSGEAVSSVQVGSDRELNPEEMSIIRHVYQFGEVVDEAAVRYSPNLVANYLYDLAQKYNSFYNKHTILGAAADVKGFRLILTDAVGQVLKNGLKVLGIEVLERM
jgi:arginyl-tRNA synthetase